MTIELAAPTPERTSWRSLPPLALVPLAALAWWLVGFLPWLLEGLGHEFGLSVRAVPVLAGSVSALVLGGGLGGVLAGLTTLLGTGTRAVRAGASSAGVAIALFVTLVQARGAVTVGVDERITNGLTVVVVIMTIAGLGLGLLGMTGRVGLGLALAAVAGAAPMWGMGVLNAMGVGYGGQLPAAQEAARWFGAVVLSVALVIVGLRPGVRAVAWPGVVLLAWIISPTNTAAGYMEVFLRPGMGLPDMWGDHLSAAMDVWRMSASPELRPLTPWIVAIVVAGGVALWRARRPAGEPDQPAQ